MYAFILLFLWVYIYLNNYIFMYLLPDMLPGKAGSLNKKCIDVVRDVGFARFLKISLKITCGI